MIVCLNSLKASSLRSGDVASATTYGDEVARLKGPEVDSDSIDVTAVRNQVSEYKRLGNAKEEAQAHLKLIPVVFSSQRAEAIAATERAVALFKSIQDDAGVASAHASLGRMHVMCGDSNAALEQLKLAVKYQRSVKRADSQSDSMDVGDGKILAEYLLVLSRAHAAAGEWNGTVEVAEEALALMEEIKHTEGILDCFNALGVAFARLGQNDKALLFLRRGAGGATLTPSGSVDRAVGVDSLASCIHNLRVVEEARVSLKIHTASSKMWKAAGDSWGEVVSEVEKAKAHMRMQEAEDAIKCLSQAMVVLEDRGVSIAEKPDDVMLLSDIMRYKGDAHLILGELSSATDALERCVEVLASITAMNPTEGVNTGVGRERLIARVRSEADALAVLGNVFAASGVHSRATAAFKRSIALCRGADSEDATDASSASVSAEREVVAIIGLGALLAGLCYPGLAIEHLQAARALASDHDLRAHEAHVVRVIGGVYFLRGDTRGCLKLLEDSLALYKSSGSTQGEASSLRWLGYAFMFFPIRFCVANFLFSSVGLGGVWGQLMLRSNISERHYWSVRLEWI